MFRHLHEISRNHKRALLSVIIFTTSGIYTLRGAHEQRAQAEQSRVEVTVRTQPRPGLRIVSGGLVYEEGLYKGGLRTRYWSPTGLVKPDTFLERGGDELPALDEPMACSFGLSVDGQDLWDYWSWKSAEELPCEAEQGTRLAREGSRKCRHAMVELASDIRPIRVKVHTQVDGNSFLKRWLEITNNGNAFGNFFWPLSEVYFGPTKVIDFPFSSLCQLDLI